MEEKPKSVNDKMLDELINYISFLKKNIQFDSLIMQEDFLSPKHKNNITKQIAIIVKQAQRIIDLDITNLLFGLSIDPNDKAILIKGFLEDLKSFATTNNIKLKDSAPVFFINQTIIDNNVFFHLSTSVLLPNTYETKDLVGGREYDLYSIPFKIRVALENKLKGIIGFQGLKITYKNKKKSSEITEEFPVSYILKVLKDLKCLNTPCSLENILNIYKWASNFCHTGQKEPMWMVMEALELISPLFLYSEQQKFRVPIASLWHEGLSCKEKLNKLKEYHTSGGFGEVLSYFDPNWNIQKLQENLNSLQKDASKKYKRSGIDSVEFILSEARLDERSACCYSEDGGCI